MIIYKIGGQHRAPKGLKYSYREIEEGGKLPDGWHASLSGAVEAHLSPNKTNTDSKAEKAAAKKAKKAAAEEAAENN